MRRLTPLTVFVVAILVSHVRSSAAEPTDSSEAVAPVSATNAAGAQFADNGFDQYRQEPSLGAPSSPSYGFKHFPFSMHMFTNWHRPKASTWTKWQRCAPDPFRPRGYGHLFSRPCDSFRMDYSPYVLSGNESQYGPAYLLRQGDQRCENCDH